MLKIVLLCLVQCVIGISTNNLPDSIVPGKTGFICLTPGCVRTAAYLLESIDESINPCENFAEFACGNLFKEKTIPNEKSHVTPFSIVNDHLLEQLKTILEKPGLPNEPKPFVLLKKYYNSCLNVSAISDDGLDTIKAVIKTVGGWPVVEGSCWKENEFDWKNVIHKFKQEGLTYDSIFRVSVERDSKNKTKRLLNLDEPTLSLDREYFIEGLESKVVKAYYNYLVDLAIIFGAEKEYAIKEINSVVLFTIELAKLKLPYEELRNYSALYRPMTIAQLQANFSFINWLDYFRATIDNPKIKISETTVVDATVPNYFKNLEKLLDKTDKRTLANYIITAAIFDSVFYLNEDLRDRQLKYKTAVYGVISHKVRWKECIEEVSDRMPAAMGALYVRTYFDENAKKKAEELVSDLKSTFRIMLKKIDWMDQATKSKALEKVNAMDSHVGYPQELLDDNVLEKYYSSLIPSDKYFLYNLNLEKFDNNKTFSKLHKAVNKSSWEDHADIATVNAFYSFTENSIQLPAGILQDVFFSIDRPNYMNYGSIGFAIGHEITHGFDDIGRQYDKDGELSEWWANETKQAFLNKAKCLIEQYGNYTVKDVYLNINGINTQGENIADNGGAKEAYLAYNAWVKRNGVEPGLPALKYTPKQFFWISSAVIWCSKMRNEYLKKLILTDFHSPPYYRIIGTLSNSEYFARDFNCDVGSFMNPKHKCGVW